MFKRRLWRFLACLGNKNNIIFPKHHKQSQQTFSTPLTSTIATTITEKLLEEIVFSAYIQASQILSGCRLSILDPNRKMISFEEVNRLAYRKLSRSKCTISKKKPVQSNNENEKDEDEDEDEDGEHHQRSKQSSANDIMDDYDELSSINELDPDTLPKVSTSTFNGMRIFDSIDDCQSESFFLVEVNGQKKFMHKQTANWYFSKTKPILSSDRLKRVQNK